MQTVIVAFYKVFPPDSGAAVVSYNTARFLSGERTLIQLDSRDKAVTLDEGFHLISLACRTESHFGKILGLMSRMASLTRRIRRMRPNVIILEGAAWTFYYWMLIRFMKLQKAKSTIVYHAHNVEYLLRKGKNNRLVCWITRLSERSILHSCHRTTAVSDVDAERFLDLYGIRPAVFPNGVDANAFARVPSARVKNLKKAFKLEGKTALFMGLTGFRPNQEALEFLLKRVFPSVVQAVPGVKLAVIGGDLGLSFPWLVNPGSIPFDDVPAFVSGCDVCLAPIFSGSGTRLKILEYMAAGKPVLATSKAAEGIVVDPGRHLFIANNSRDFIRILSSLLRNPGQGRQRALEGQRLVRRKYSWPVLVAAFEEGVTPTFPKA